jgi:nitroreductase
VAAKAGVVGKSAVAGKSGVAPKAVAAGKSGVAAKVTAASNTAASRKSVPGKPAAAPKPGAAPKPVAAADREPRDVVRPLVRVRQMREFTSRRVTRAELEAITEVARWSGSSRNEQPCRFIAIRDQETIQRIAALGLPQTRGLPTATAAVAIVVPNEAERELSRAFDDGRAAERILIAANLLGLGGGIARVRQDVRESIDQALGLPPNRSVRTIVGLGHPTADALAPKSKPGHARLPREEVVYDERWPERPRIE